MGRAAEIARQIRWYWGSLMGDNHYRRYVEHRTARPSRRTDNVRTRVLADAHDATEANPNPRCC